MYNLWKKNKVGLKQSTYVNYLYMYEHFIGPKIGKMKIKDIRKSTVLGLYNDLTRSSDIGKTMAINTLEVIHNVLRQVLQVAVDDDYIRKNPTEGALREVKKANNYERPKRKALTLEQQNAFVKFLKSKPLYYSWSILFASCWERVAALQNLSACAGVILIGKITRFPSITTWSIGNIQMANATFP